MNMKEPDLRSWRPSRVGVIGAGAMGLSLACVLARSRPVVLVARNPHAAEAISRSGLRARGEIDRLATPEIVRRIPDLAGPRAISVVFVATKTSAIDSVADELAPLLPRLGDQPGSPFVVSFQNGIEPGRRLIERLGDPRVLRMVLNYSARLESPSIVRIIHNRPPHFIGSLAPEYLPVCRRIARLLSVGGLQTRAVEDIEPSVWRKGIINAAVNPVAALTDAPVGEVLDSPARAIVARLLDEGIAVAQAEGIDLGDDPAAGMWQAIEAARPHVPSMVSDIRLGRPSEVGQLNRQVIAHARRVGVDAPTHELVTALIDAFDWRVFHRADGPLPHPAVERPCRKAPA